MKINNPGMHEVIIHASEQDAGIQFLPRTLIQTQLHSCLRVKWISIPEYRNI